MNFLKPIISIVICEAVGIFGAVFTAPAIPTWYASLKKPSFSPPNWVFGPAWTFLYALMGISAYLIWQEGVEKPAVRNALFIFLLQLILNFFWSFFFFKLQSPTHALIEIFLLWVLILATVISFYQINKAAGLILIPYLLWVSFATLLNFYIVRLN
jgi:tryptophan-rich sensory protein